MIGYGSEVIVLFSGMRWVGRTFFW